MLTPYKTIWMQNPWKCPYDYFIMAIKNCCGLCQIFEVSSMKITFKGLIHLCFSARFGDLCVFCFVSLCPALFSLGCRDQIAAIF